VGKLPVAAAILALNFFGWPGKTKTFLPRSFQAKKFPKEAHPRFCWQACISGAALEGNFMVELLSNLCLSSGNF
jgi:hypothetical protein